ncbi:MAG: hypothetical protein SFX74_09440 [Fimbriimonadaceae bacterium]|nr:hypothetical protein [Fimbriimonadaceae bacterium]
MTVQPNQPKITQRLLLRTLFLALALAVVVAAYQWLQSLKGDFDLAPANTAGMIAAVQFEADGQRVVAFSPDGKKVENPGWRSGITDRDHAWSSDGNRLFFISDRNPDANAKDADIRAFNIFRWNPVTNSNPEQRTTSSRGRSNPNFADEVVEGAPNTALITSGGFVLEFNPKERKTTQVLPPIGREVAISDEESGATSQFSGLYGKFGTSFRFAKWCGKRRFIAGVMRGDEGETLVVQDTELNAKGELPPPVPVMAGERVDFVVDPKTGRLVYSVQNFRWVTVEAIPPQFREGNKVTVPFRHGLGIHTPGQRQDEIITFSQDFTMAFGAPTIKPDGSQIAVTVGKYADSSLSPTQLILLPVTANATEARSVLLEGEVFEPNFSPDGKQLAFIRRKGGKRAIAVINSDGSGERVVADDRDYSTPKFSTQIAASTP